MGKAQQGARSKDPTYWFLFNLVSEEGYMEIVLAGVI